MSKERKSTSRTAIQVKNRRKTVGIEGKFSVIGRLYNRKRIVDVWLMFRLACSTVGTIWDNVDRSTESAQSGTKVFV
jgi:hypothetical protein